MSDPQKTDGSHAPDHSDSSAGSTGCAEVDLPVKTPRRPYYSRRRVQIGLAVTLIGFMTFMIGIRPDFFGLDRSPVIGFVQVAVFLVGLGFMCLGGYMSLMALWKHQKPSLAVEFGIRLVATGYVVTVFTGMADVFGFGSHMLPGVPFFGPWQARGVVLGQTIIAIGFLLLIPYTDQPSQEVKAPAKPK
jgi:hypothetical protein